MSQSKIITDAEQLNASVTRALSNKRGALMAIIADLFPAGDRIAIGYEKWDYNRGDSIPEWWSTLDEAEAIEEVCGDVEKRIYGLAVDQLDLADQLTDAAVKKFVREKINELELDDSYDGWDTTIVEDSPKGVIYNAIQLRYENGDPDIIALVGNDPETGDALTNIVTTRTVLGGQAWRIGLRGDEYIVQSRKSGHTNWYDERTVSEDVYDEVCSRFDDPACDDPAIIAFAGNEDE